MRKRPIFYSVGIVSADACFRYLIALAADIDAVAGIVDTYTLQVEILNRGIVVIIGGYALDAARGIVDIHSIARLCLAIGVYRRHEHIACVGECTDLWYYRESILGGIGIDEFII